MHYIFVCLAACIDPFISLLFQSASLEKLMYLALQLNRVEFVELFLEHGVKLEIISRTVLPTLYNKVRYPRL